MIEQLSSLARETSSDKRRELMGEVADLFVVGADNFNDRELILFGEILTKLLDDVDVGARVRLSSSVAPVDNTPRDLVMALAQDDIEVATPILQRSSVLTDEDLVEIASTKTTDHRIAISGRENLGVAVTTALLAHGEQPVFHSLCENRTAQFSDDGFHALADSAMEDKVLCEMLSHRADMPLGVVRRVLPVMSESACERLKEVVEAKGDAALTDLFNEASKQSKEASDNSKREYIQSKVLLEEILNEKRGLKSTIANLSQDNRLIDVAVVLSGYTGLPENQIVNALMKKNGQAIAVLCRGLGFSVETFSIIVEMRRQRLKLKDSECIVLTEEYSASDAAGAKRTMRFVKVRNTAMQA